MKDIFSSTTTEAQLKFRKDRLMAVSNKLTEDGYNLPKEYIEFLLNYDGSEIKKDTFYMLDSSEEGVRWFYHLNDQNSLYDIERENITRGTVIPPTFFAIGEDSFGNTICVCVKDGDDYGKVYFWDHEEYWYIHGGTQETSARLISESVTDFINSLYSFDGEEDERGDVIKWIRRHDRYSLPYYLSTNPKYRDLINSFFSKAPLKVEEFIIEEMEETKDLILKYEVLEEKKRYVRIIFARTGKHRDLEEDIELE